MYVSGNPANENINNSNNTVFIVAGEESGDIHGSFLVKELLKIKPYLNFIGHGGDKMQAAGVNIIEHISNLSLVGFTEVIKHLPYMRRVMNSTIKQIKQIKPVRIILIDYPGFNLNLAKRIHALKIPITYFILPQVWAWKAKRYKKLKLCTDQAISIIPFEKTWYKNKGMEIDFAGNPLIDVEEPTLSKRAFFAKHSFVADQPLLTLLPGSRQQEIDYHWPILKQAVEELHKIFPKLQFIIGEAPNVKISDVPDYVQVESENSYLTMIHGTAGIVASGTASLEATIFKLPCVVCYRTSALTHTIGKKLATVKFLSLTNLIASEKIIPELIQKDMHPQKIIKAIVPLLSDTPERAKMITGYKTVINQLGESGVYKRTAKLIASKI